MKKCTALALALMLLLTSVAAPVATAVALTPAKTDPFQTSSYTSEDLDKLQSAAAYSYAFLPAGEKWSGYIKNLEPATFSKDKIKYTYAGDVIKINNISDSLADMGQIMSKNTIQKLPPGRIVEKGGYISRAVLDEAAGKEIKNGAVIVDEATGTAFKVSSKTVYSGIFDADPELNKLLKPLEGTYSVIKPELHEIFSDFELKEDTVKLNRANITGFAPNVENSVKPFSVVPVAVDDEDKQFKYLTGDNLIKLDFKDATAVQGKVGGSKIHVVLSGGIAIDSIKLTGRYSCNGGYEISVTMQQESYLVATLDAEVHEEIKVPILAINIPFGIGSVYGGIYAVIGMDGTIRLDIEAREKNACKMGIGGSTFLYVPTSFHPIFEPTTPEITGDCGLNGQINGFIKFGPMLGLELFGFDLVGAGVLLGAGVNVVSDGSMMDVELYASIEVYVTLADKQFNLVRARPTIYKKQQPDMHGYRVSFLETYISPGRVGGLIEEEPDNSGEAYLPSAGLDYRVRIIPRKMINSFNAEKRESFLLSDAADLQDPVKERVRTYPQNGFAKTNDEGEFYQPDPVICYEGDHVYLEYIGKVKDKNGNIVPKTFFVGPATPILPFTDITITSTDFFNDYITGKVEPKRMIDWEANRLNPDEIQTELTYYQGPIFISPFNDYGMETSTKHRSYTISGTARTDTNGKGEFDTRNPYRDINGISHASGDIDVLEQSGQQYVYYENGEKKYSSVYPSPWVGVVASLRINEASRNIVLYGIEPGMPEFQITRSLEYVKDSYIQLTDGGRLIDQMEYDEYIWISNPIGTRTITADMLDCVVRGYSSQDYRGESDHPVTTTRQGKLTLTPVLDIFGNPTGTALYAQRVTAQWVWQEHPNPIRITSDDHTQVQTGAQSVYQVTANGFLPRYSLEQAPSRVWIDEKTGQLYIPQTLSQGEYSFTIHVKEGLAIQSVAGPDPKKGNDSSPPDKQVFTLTVTGKNEETAPETSGTTAASSPGTTAASSPGTTAASSPGTTATSTPETSGTSSKPTVSSEQPQSSSSKPDERTAPEIYADEYNAYLKMDGSKDLTVSFKASGSTPVVWSLTPADGGPVPGEMIIDADTGVLTVAKSLAEGTYRFAVKAANSVGSDLHQCVLIMEHPLSPPVLENRRDGYKFAMTRTNTSYSVQIKASGSEPITYSLEAVNERIPVPAGITIDAATGILKVKGGLIGGIPSGVYEFVVKASNKAGSDSRSCRLEVTSPILPRQNSAPEQVDGLRTVSLAGTVKRSNSSQKIIVPDVFTEQEPPNKMTIRCDDTKDVYTHDRNVYNGAGYIHWDLRLTVKIAKVMDISYLTGTSLDGKSLSSLEQVVDIKDNTPVCDQYHYYGSNTLNLPLSEEESAKIKTEVKKAVDKAVAEYRNGYTTIQKDNAADLFQIKPMDRTTSVLEYGTLVDEIVAKKGGSFSVDLNADTGTVVSGAYFAALKDCPNASIVFRQDRASIAFSGKDIQSPDAQDLLNIGFTSAYHEKAILDAVGTGYESFAYGFQHHGMLPGTADFSIETTFAAGETVNVYKYDPLNNKFTLIAKDVAAGKDGVVTYKNNSMSEYVITTKTITDAEKSDSINGPESSRGIVWMFVGIALTMAAIGVFWLIYRKKKRKE